MKNQSEYNNIQNGFKSHYLTDEGIAQLESIGFYFTVTGRLDDQWDERLQKLKEFKETLGHFDVPNDDTDYQSLRLWMAQNQEEHNKIQQGEKRIHLTPGRLLQLREMGFQFKGTVTTVPKVAIEYKWSHQGALLHSSESKSDSDEEPKATIEYEESRQGSSLHSKSDSHEEVKRGDWNTSRRTSPSKPRVVSETYHEVVPEKVSITADVSLQGESQKLAVATTTRNLNMALAPSFLLGLDDAVNAMVAEMNRVELEHEKSETDRNANRGKPNLFWLDIGDCDGIEFF
jgi:hypothetical protein